MQAARYGMCTQANRFAGSSSVPELFLGGKCCVTPLEDREIVQSPAPRHIGSLEVSHVHFIISLSWRFQDSRPSLASGQSGGSLRPPGSGYQFLRVGSGQEPFGWDFICD